MPHKALLDPQGKTVTLSMTNLGLPEIENVRIGKHISLQIDEKNKEEASIKINEACTKLLANPIMESFEFELTQI